MIVITGLVPVIHFSTGVERKPCALRRLVAAVTATTMDCRNKSGNDGQLKFDNMSNSEGEGAHQIIVTRPVLIKLTAP